MASTIPALRGRFGVFEYWISTMHVGELVQRVTIPKDLPHWDSLTLDERYQRDINLTRVKKEIAPYFANEPDRFSSALVLAVLNDDGMGFEPLTSIGSGTQRMPNLYKSAAENIGFLTFSGQEVFVPLDGQHRVKALAFAISGTDNNNVSILNVPPNSQLAADDIAVILVRFDPQKSRRIFSKINRYAKPTSRGQNLITDDDDAVAVATRTIVNDAELPPGRLVRWQSNTLNAKAVEFTTLSTLYDANVAIIKAGPFPSSLKPEKANKEQRKLFETELEEVWQLLLQEIECFAEAVRDSSETGDPIRIDIRTHSLLGKPIGQLSAVRAFLLIRDRCSSISDSEVCHRLNRVDWRIKSEMWHGVLMNQNGRIMAGKTTVNFAAHFIAHLGGAKLTDEERTSLIDHIAGGDKDYQLPSPIV